MKLISVLFISLVQYANGQDWPNCNLNSNDRGMCHFIWHQGWKVHNMYHLASDTIGSSNFVNTMKSIIPTIEGRVPSTAPTHIPRITDINNKLPSSLPTQAGHLPTIKSYTSNIPTMYPHVLTTIPSIKAQTNLISSMVTKLDTIENNQQSLANSIFDIELILCQKSNQTIDELKEYLDELHSRVQLRPTLSPTLNPTIPTVEPTNDPTYDPTMDPTVDPTRDPTLEPTIPSAEPTQDPTGDPTTDPTVEPSMDPTAFPSAEPSLSPTETFAGEFTLVDGVNDGSGVDEVGFNVIYDSNENEYGIIRRICAACSSDFQEIFYRVNNVSSSYNPYQMMVNWRQGADNEHEIIWEFNLYSTLADALRKENNWYDCREHDPVDDGIVSGFGICKRKRRDSWGYCQYSSTDPGCNKDVTFSLFVGDPEYVGVSIAEVESARSINWRPMIINDHQDTEWEKHRNDHEPEPNYNDGTKGAGYNGDGNILITITAKEFDVGMIFSMFMLMIASNIIICKYGCCGKESRHKYTAVKPVDSEFDSEVTPIKQ